MALTSGTRLGPYEILARIGAGGMGEVYKAKDTRLDRTLAIKVLPEHLAESPERKARFEREAKAISQLNHPHICTLYDVGEQDGIDFIVMEYIEGESLAARLKKGALKLDRAIEYGIQIASALDRAHRVGIVHRDLKPGNVMVTKSGVKLLDFGLAKLVDDQGVSEDSDAPTQHKDLTTEQTIIGTPQYMAPEQLEGKTADARADIFAFGAVLYELVTGNKAFEGHSQATLITATMSMEPPPPSETRPLSPPGLDWLVAQCLTKDPAARMQSAHDVMLQLRSVEKAHGPVQQRAWPRFHLAWIAAIMSSIAAVTVLVSNLARTQAILDLSPKRFTVAPPSIDRLVDVSLAVSPSGEGFVYVGSNAGIPQLFWRQWSTLEVKPLEGTDEAVAPFYSPDGTWVGFFAHGQLKKVQLSGGPPLVLCDAPRARSGTWGVDGTIVFASYGSGLQRVSAMGGVAKPLTTVDADRGEIDHRLPSFLPNGKGVLFDVRAVSPRFQVAVLHLETGERRLLLRGSSARYLATGHLVYSREESTGTFVAVAFDSNRLEASGEPVPVLEGVLQAARMAELDVKGTAGRSFDIGGDGTLVYVPTARGDSSLVWVSRDGRQTALEEEQAMYRYPSLAPDGRRAALTTASGGALDIWVHDIDRRTRTLLTRGGRNVYPVWTPDGDRVTFSANADDLFWAAADGSQEPELLLEKEGSQLPFSWSPDGRTLAFGDGGDIWHLPIGGEPSPFLTTAAKEMSAAFSPDGRWLAYVSDESGRDEIYVQSYPDPGRRWTLSTSGGRAPLWSPQGHELYYRNDNQVMVISVETTPNFAAGAPRMLFEGDYSPPSTGGNPYYDISPDAQRFLMLTYPRITELQVVLNWPEEVKSLVPVQN